MVAPYLSFPRGQQRLWQREGINGAWGTCQASQVTVISYYPTGNFCHLIEISHSSTGISHTTGSSVTPPTHTHTDPIISQGSPVTLLEFSVIP